MLRAVDIKAELAGRPVLSERGKDTTEAEAEGRRSPYWPVSGRQHLRGELFGRGALGRHRKGDELVHILDLAPPTLTIRTDRALSPSR